MAAARLPEVLAEAGKARQLSLELDGVEYAGELGSSLRRHAADTEKLYTSLKKAVNNETDNDAYFKKIFALLDEKTKWFAKAKAGPMLDM